MTENRSNVQETQPKPTLDWAESWGRYQAALSSNEQLKDIREKETNKQRIDVLQVKKVFGFEWDLGPIVDQTAFVVQSKLEFLPSDLRTSIQSLFQYNPRLLLELDTFLASQEEASDFEQHRTAVLQELAPARVDKIKALVATIPVSEKRKATQTKTVLQQWLARFRNSPEAVTEQETEELIAAIHEAAQQWRELVYAHQVLGEAGRILQTLIPGMAKDTQEIVDVLVILQPRKKELTPKLFQRIKRSLFGTQIPKNVQTQPAQPENVAALSATGMTNSVATAIEPLQEPSFAAKSSNTKLGENFFEGEVGTAAWWFATSDDSGKRGMISVPPELATENPAKYAQDVMIMLHELLHCLVEIKLDLTMTTDLASLGGGILEGISIAAEYMLLKAFERIPGQEEFWQVIDSFGKGRLKFLRKMNRVWSDKGRKELADERGASEVKIANTGVYYSEGVRLAIALQRNGWKLADLPELMEEMKGIAQRVTGKLDSKEWSKTLVDRAPEPPKLIRRHNRLVQLYRQVFAPIPPYQKVMEELRQLKPSVASPSP